MESHRACSAARGATAAALSLALLPAGCQSMKMPRDLRVKPSVTYWRPEAHGHADVEAGSAPASGTNADLPDDLGADHDDQWLGRLDVETGKHRVTAEYLPIRLSGDTVSDRTFLYQGTRSAAGDLVKSELELTTWSLRWDYALSQEKRSEDAFRVGLGAYWWSFDGQVKDRTLRTDERRSFSRVYPGAHATMTFDLDNGFFTELSAVVAGTGYHRRLTDLGAGLSYQMSDATRATIGYRWILWDYDETNNDGDFDLRGPHVTVTFMF